MTIHTDSSVHTNTGVKLHHPTLGTLRGLQASNDVVQFLGLQYASLSDGLARGVLHQGVYSEQVHDATKHGPNVINPSDACEREQKLIQAHLPFSELPQSDVDCLTLNISVPTTYTTSAAQQLPVLAFVHGGAFPNGSSSHPQYDLARITAAASEIGKPMIAIGINYRVGVPGFLHSAELDALGYKPNNGLDDQRLALRWVQQYIGGFGGNPARVTFLGQSAGSSSGCFHLQRSEPLFHQYISMGGTSLLRQRTYSRLQQAFDLITAELGADSQSPTSKVQSLLAAVKAKNIGPSGRRYGVGPVVDGDLVPHATSFSSLETPADVLECFPGVRYCKKIIVGDCEADGMVWLNRLTSRSYGLSESLGQSLSSCLQHIDSARAPYIAEAYKLTGDYTTLPILRFGTDLTFALPARTLANAWSKSHNPGTEGYLFHFDIPNPWEGKWKNHATHVLDIACALLNFEEQLPEGQHACARRLTNDIIRFVHEGVAPWQPYDQAGSRYSMRYSAPIESQEDCSAVVSDAELVNSGRVGHLYSLKDARVLDRMTDAWQSFMDPR